MNKFPERLKELRTEKELSYERLGKLIGVSNSSICRWENKQNDIKSEELVKVAKFFDVSTDYLLGLED